MSGLLIRSIGGGAILTTFSATAALALVSAMIARAMRKKSEGESEEEAMEDEFDSVSGLIMHELNEFPHPGCEITIGNIQE